jgi:hypothetical protein
LEMTPQRSSGARTTPASVLPSLRASGSPGTRSQRSNRSPTGMRGPDQPLRLPCAPTVPGRSWCPAGSPNPYSAGARRGSPRRRSGGAWHRKRGRAGRCNGSTRPAR